MRIKNLFLALLALPLMFVACNEDKPVDKVKDATVTVTAGTATENTLSFTVASTNAEKVAYLVVEGDAPTASEILTNGTAVDANKSVELTATELKAETKYTIVAAAQNSKGVVKNSIEMTTLAAETPGPDPGPDTKVEFVATNLDTDYFNEEGHIYVIMLGDKEFGESGWGVDGGTYFTIFILTSSKGNGVLPNGRYALGEEESYTANTILYDSSFRYQMANGIEMVNGMELFKEGYITISDGKIDGEFVLDRDDSVHHVVYEGDLSVDDGSGNQGGDADVTLTADKWLWGGSSSYGNKYQVVGEGFSVDVHFPAKYATEDALAAGDYIWTNTSWWGYNDFENEFTTRSFLIDGAYASIVKEGTASVSVEGDVYTIELKLKAETANYLVKYSGKLSDTTQGGGDEGDEVVFTKIESLGYNSAYYFYEFKLTNEAGDAMQLCVNDYQAKESFIYTDDAFEWISIGYCGNLGFFSTRNIVVGGTSYNATSGSMAVVTDEATHHMDITVNLLLNAGGAKTFKFSGKVGDNGGETPAEPTKLDTPSVSGLVSGNAATISWQDVAGAKDYSVSLNGTFLQTVETAYIVLTDLEYSTTYSVSVVANPADTAVNTASDAGTASFTTEADPNAGGDEPGGDEPATDFIDWHFSAHYNTDNCVVTLTGKDDSRVITVKTNSLAFAQFYADTTRSSYFTDVTVDGVATSDVTAESYVHVQQTQVSINLVINGITYTGNSDGFTY